jgi:hypothetical protein
MIFFFSHKSGRARARWFARCGINRYKDSQEALEVGCESQ